jgi:hypothetical protein
MSHKIGRIAALIATVTALGAVAVAAPPASAAQLVITPKFTNWVVAGSLTAKKSQQTVTLPQGSTFNGSGELILEEVSGLVLGHGTITGSVFVPPFNAVLTLPILGIPTPVTTGITFNQVGQAEGTVTPATGCVQVNACVKVTVPTKANVGFTVVGILGVQVPTHCETSEPVELALTQTLNLLEIVRNGNHFTGTTTIPPIKCPGLLGLVLGPVLTTALSGPENPYTISITPPPE